MLRAVSVVGLMCTMSLSYFTRVHTYTHTHTHTHTHTRCGTPSQEWVLLYRASRDGYEARKFHAACDEKGATLTIVKVLSSVNVEAWGK